MDVFTAPVNEGGPGWWWCLSVVGVLPPFLFRSLLNNRRRTKMRTPVMAPRTPAMIAVVFAFCVELVDGLVVLEVAGLGVVVLAVAGLGVVALSVAGLGVVVSSVAGLGVVVLSIAGLGVVVLFSEAEGEVEVDDWIDAVRSAYTGDISAIRVYSPAGLFWASVTSTRSCKQRSDLGNLMNLRTSVLFVISALWVHPEPSFVSTVKSSGKPSSPKRSKMPSKVTATVFSIVKVSGYTPAVLLHSKVLWLGVEENRGTLKSLLVPLSIFLLVDCVAAPEISCTYDSMRRRPNGKGARWPCLVLICRLGNCGRNKQVQNRKHWSRGELRSKLEVASSCFPDFARESASFSLRVNMETVVANCMDDGWRQLSVAESFGVCTEHSSQP